MKTFLYIFSLGFSILLLSSFTILKIITNEETSSRIEVVTFDGFEGDTYFFTDARNKAVTIMDKSDNIISKPLLKNSKDIGSPFKIMTKTPLLEKKILVLQSDVLKFEKISN